jgi:hypothetical protein
MGQTCGPDGDDEISTQDIYGDTIHKVNTKKTKKQKDNMMMVLGETL